MDTPPGEVGAAFEQALARAAHHRQTSSRKVSVKLVPISGEKGAVLRIRAHIPAKSPAEVEAQLGRGVREVPWRELDARAAERPALVDEAVAEIEAAVAVRPSQREDDFDGEAFERLAAKACNVVIKVLGPLVEGAPASISRSGALEAVLLGLTRVTVLSGATARMSTAEVHEMLEDAFRDRTVRDSSRRPSRG